MLRCCFPALSCVNCSTKYAYVNPKVGLALGPDCSHTACTDTGTHPLKKKKNSTPRCVVIYLQAKNKVADCAASLPLLPHPPSLPLPPICSCIRWNFCPFMIASVAGITALGLFLGTEALVMAHKGIDFSVYPKKA